MEPLDRFSVRLGCNESNCSAGILGFPSAAYLGPQEKELGSGAELFLLRDGEASARHGTGVRVHTGWNLKLGGLRMEAAQLSVRRQSDREDRNDFVAAVDNDDFVADHEVPESPPLGMDVHDD